MYLIEDILLDEQIPNKNFLCDLEKCKGGCCTIPGDSGAPLAESEISELDNSYAAASKYLPKRNLDYIKEHGYWQTDSDGDLATTVIDGRDCVFVYYDGDIAKCALERAYINGETEFQKPISCHLFPIRVGNYGGPYLYYEEFDVCKPGIANGEQKKVKLMDMLREPIIRAYGEQKYAMLKAFTENLDNTKEKLEIES